MAGAEALRMGCAVIDPQYETVHTKYHYPKRDTNQITVVTSAETSVVTAEDGLRHGNSIQTKRRIAESGTWRSRIVHPNLVNVRKRTTITNVTCRALLHFWHLLEHNG